MVSGIRIVRPTHRAVVERLGKYNRYQEPGIIWIVPFVEKQISVNITEQMTEAMEQEIITKDNLNAKVDAQVYFKVKPSEETVKASLYGVYNYSHQIIALAQTSLRNVIGGKEFVEVNSKRNTLNDEIKNLIQAQTVAWGIDIVRVELKQIVPPTEVQNTMNKVIQANNAKVANIDFATAAETEADGLRKGTFTMKKPELTEYQKEVLAVVLDMTDQGKKSVKVEDVIKEMQRREGLPNHAFKGFCPKCQTVHTTITCPTFKNDLSDHPHSDLVKEFGYCTFCSTIEADGQ